MKRGGPPRRTLALVFTIVLVASVIAIIAASTQQPAAPTGAKSTTASTPQGSKTAATSQSSTSSTVSATSQTPTFSLVSRVADTQSTYAANVSSSVTAPTGTNTTMSSACNPGDSATTELQVVSDSTGMPVSQGAAAVSAVYQYGCYAIDFQAHETLYFDRVSEGSSGWFDFPRTPGGFNFTVGYAGHAYLFPGSGGSYPDSTTCVTLAVPSGIVTLARYQLSNYDCAGNLGSWAANATYPHRCFGEVYLRVLSDSDSAPVAGAVVTTAYDFPSTCVQAIVYASDLSGEAFKYFTTATSTEWYAFGDASNSFSVIYGGQAYNVTASQSAASTCVTLYVPSGAVNTTYGASCATTASSISTTQRSSTTTSNSTTATESSSTTFLSTSSSSSGSSTGSSPSIAAAEVAKVTLTPWPGQIAVNPVTGKVYVSDLFANTLTVLNASNRAIIRTITLPGTPGGIVVDTETDMVYVPVSGCTNLPNVSNSCNSPGGERLQGGIVTIDGRNDTIAGEFPIDVQQLAIDPTRHVLYGVSNEFVSTAGPVYLFAFDENSGTLLSAFPLPLGVTPLDMAVNPRSNMVYLSACGQMSLACGNAEVLGINETSHLVQWTAPLGYVAINFPLAFDSTSDSVYVMGETGGNLTLEAIDGLTGNPLYSASLGSSCAGAGGGGMVVDTTSNRLYVVSDSENFLLVVDEGTGMLVGTFNTPQSGGEYNIGLNPATHEVYLTLESSSHLNIGYLVVLSGEGLNRISQVQAGFLQRGVCLP